MNDTKYMKKIFYFFQYTKKTSLSSSVGSASLNRSSSLSLIISSCYFLMKICSFYTLLHGTRTSHRKNSIIQISPRVNDWGLIRTGGLFQNLGLHGGLFEYGGLIETGGLNEDLRYNNMAKQKVTSFCANLSGYGLH